MYQLEFYYSSKLQIQLYIYVYYFFVNLWHVGAFSPMNIYVYVYVYICV